MYTGLRSAGYDFAGHVRVDLAGQFYEATRVVKSDSRAFQESTDGVDGYAMTAKPRTQINGSESEPFCCRGVHECRRESGKGCSRSKMEM